MTSNALPLTTRGPTPTPDAPRAAPAAPSTAALPPPADAVRLPLGPGPAELAPGERRWLVAGVAAVHLLAVWGLLQVGAVQQTLRQVAPLMVDFIAPPAPDRPRPPPPPQTRRPPTPTAQPAPQPVVAAPAPPVVAPAEFAVPAPAPAPVVAAPAPPAPPAPAAPAAPPAPPAPKPVAASALRYAVLPPVELPLASRRLGESGTVLVRVVFDTAGRARQVALHRSSGFARLDEQALAAMRQARIAPYLEAGQPIEVSAIAPLAYELE